MRFDNYIVIDEEVDRLQLKVENIIEMIFKDCDYYINQLRKSNAFKLLYRSSKDSTSFYKLKTSRLETGRNPLDTNVIIHNLLNKKIFNPVFGWNVRDGIFASSKRIPYYGEPYLFFPIGEFKYVWSPTVKDLYEDMFDPQKLDFLYYYADEDDKIVNPNIKNISDNDIRLMVKNLQSMYSDKDFKGAVRSENEISFKCNKYYLVNYYMVDNFEKWLLDLIYHPESESKYNPFKVNECLG